MHFLGFFFYYALEWKEQPYIQLDLYIFIEYISEAAALGVGFIILSSYCYIDEGML